MRLIFTEDQHFEGLETFTPGEYSHCQFSHCNFTNAEMGKSEFSNCIFRHCDWSMATLKGTSFRDVQFQDCKMLGLRLDECDGFALSFSFKNCQLDYASFYKLKLPGTQFWDCKMEETDLAEADFSNAVFHQCFLQGAVFDNTRLEGADLRTAQHFTINPTTNRITKARFAQDNIAGLVRSFKIIIE